MGSVTVSGHGYAWRLNLGLQSFGVSSGFSSLFFNYDFDFLLAIVAALQSSKKSLTQCTSHHRVYGDNCLPLILYYSLLSWTFAWFVWLFMMNDLCLDWLVSMAFFFLIVTYGDKLTFSQVLFLINMLTSHIVVMTGGTTPPGPSFSECVSVTLSPYHF